MKKFYLSILFSLLINNAFSQTCEWAHNVVQPERSKGVLTRQDYSGNYYFASHRDSIIVSTQSYVEKRNNQQQFLWSKTVTGNVVISDIEVRKNNNLIVMGYFEKTMTIDANTITGNNLYTTGFLCELSPAGNVSWLKLLDPGLEGIIPFDLFIAKDESLYFTTDLYNSNFGFVSFHKADANGNIIKTKNDSTYRLRSATNIICDDAGNVFVNGTNEETKFDTIPVQSNEPYQLFLAKYNSDFKAQWVINKAYITFDHNSFIELKGDTLVWIYGEFDSIQSIQILKVDQNGNIKQSMKGPDVQFSVPSFKMSMSPSGYMTLIYNQYSKYILHQFDPSFNLMFTDTVSSVCSDEIEIKAYDSVFYFSALIGDDSTNVGGHWVKNPSVKLNYPCGMMVSKWSHPYKVTTGINRNISRNIISVYPNPTSYKVYFDSDILSGNFTLLNNAGRMTMQGSIADLKNGLDVSNLNAGIYFIQIITQDNSDVFSAKISIVR